MRRVIGKAASGSAAGLGPRGERQRHEEAYETVIVDFREAHLVKLLKSLLTLDDKTILTYESAGGSAHLNPPLDAFSEKDELGPRVEQIWIDLITELTPDPTYGSPMPPTGSLPHRSDRVDMLVISPWTSPDREHQGHVTSTISGRQQAILSQPH